VDFVALLADNFSINGSIGYTQGRYTEVDPAFDIYVGTDLPRLSPWTASLGATYDVDMGDAGFLTFRANYSFRDRAAYNDANTHYFDQQHESSASVNYTTPDDRWKLSLYGKNLNDEARWGNLTSIGGAYTAGPMQKGRVWGLEAEYRY
jgi:iron complex outermembrane receptor protein